MGRVKQPDGRVHGVVAAVRRSDGRYLMVRRSRVVKAPLKVCFPGGTMEAGETQEQTLVREMMEELGVRVTPIRCVWKHEFPDKPVTLWGWTADLPASEGRFTPDPREIAEVLWLLPAEGAEHVEGMPTNRLFIAALAASVT